MKYITVINKSVGYCQNITNLLYIWILVYKPLIIEALEANNMKIQGWTWTEAYHGI